ncbi:CPBP family intramembrane glutamic endopeptidase [Ochrovirga pacifica]|uniref:CPBP family intramembrane glutamic endopeptidase n=1 Tax=Ochrovirga pacifica TaxID=1042376 RepID=UPI00135F10B5|nr:type II CAAX endopeptidase family protein [Ochrovirga pacifica]
MKKNLFYPNINQSFILILILCLVSIPASIPIILVSLFPDFIKTNPEFISIGVLLSYLITFLWTIWIAKRKINKRGQNILIKKEPIPLYFYFLLVIITLCLGILIEPLSELIPMPEEFAKIFEDLIRPDIFSFLTVVIAAPILEEVLFRSIIFEGFLKNYSPWKSIIWSAIIFGTAHLNPWQMIGGIFIGILIAWIYFRTDSIIPGIVIHFTNNFIGFLLFTYSDGRSLSKFLTSISNSFMVYFTSIFLLISILYWINKKLKTT